MTADKLHEFLKQERIERTLQDDIIIAFHQWISESYSEAELELELTEYTVHGSDRTNAAASIGGIIHIVYVENANCFIVCTQRMSAMVAQKHGMTTVPETFMYPNKCFGRSVQDLADACEYVLQRCSDAYVEEHESMDKVTFQRTIDEALENREFAKLNMLDRVIKKKLI